MIIRPTDASEAAEIAEVHRAAFGSDLEADLARDLMLDDAFVPSLSFAAEEDGKLVGHVLFTRAWLNRDDGMPGFPLLLLAPLAVVPAAQHEGVGTALVEAAITLAQDSGEVAMLVFGDPKFYGRFGFVQAGASGVRTPHPAEPAWGWQVLELAPDTLGEPGTLQVAAPLDEPAMWVA
ncbi:MAG: N-acetyltransferase [Coriobacteriia bacterium]|nr:N-acetyltransferase [Coriobacteriia bacterium]